MVKKAFLTVFTLGTSLGLAFWCMTKKPKNLAAEAPLHKEAVVDLPELSAASPPGQEDEPSPENVQSTAPIRGNAFSEADFLDAYRATDFAESLATARLVERLEAQNPKDVALYAQNLLESIGSTDLNERGRLIFLANELRASELLPFWMKVLERSPKALEDEAAYFRAKEPTVPTMALRNEISAALRNLSVLSYRDDAARNALVDYAKAPDPAFDNTLFRKEAFYRVREVNVTAAARVLRGLPTDDPLRAAISQD